MRETGLAWLIVGLVVVIAGIVLGVVTTNGLNDLGVAPSGLSPNVAGAATAIVPCGIGLLLIAIGSIASEWGGSE